jgi:hypothetical protein
VIFEYLAGDARNLDDGHPSAVRQNEAHLEQDFDLVLKLLLVAVRKQFRAVPALQSGCRPIKMCGTGMAVLH